MIEYLVMTSVIEFYSPWIGMLGNNKLPSHDRPFQFSSSRHAMAYKLQDDTVGLSRAGIRE